MRHNPLTLWHLLSLDAPTIAALWTWFIARSCGVALPFTPIAAMFLAVWILYAADRLLDARSADPTTLEERHHFHHRHRRIFIALIAIATIALAALIPDLYPKALRIQSLLGALLCGWFLMIHTRLAHERRLPKELAVGLFFAAAIFVPAISRRPDLRLTLLAPAALFAAVCSLNCMYLYAWEHPGNRPNANWTTRLTTHRLTQASTLIFTASILTVLLCAPLRFPSAPSAFPLSLTSILLWKIPAACALSTLLLLTLNHYRKKLSPLTLRAAADLALLTPLVFIFPR